MISSVAGKIIQKDERSVVVQTNGIGYKIFLSQDSLNSFKIGNDVSFFTHMHVGETFLDLYGFPSNNKLVFFKHLISISGIGPKSGLNVLDSATMEDIIAAIKNNDPGLLTKVSGIGKKTAERIIVELKNKVDLLPSDLQPTTLQSGDADVFSALESLGYSNIDIREVIKKIPSSIDSTDERIKEALKLLSHL